MGEHQAQLEWERQTGRLAAGAAFAAVLLPIIGTIYIITGLDSQPDNTREFMGVLEKESSTFLIYTIIQSLMWPFVAAVLHYLYRAASYRRPDLPKAASVLAIVGPLLLFVAGILVQLDRIDNAQAFNALPESRQTEARADDMLVDQSPLTQSIGLAGGLGTAFAQVMISIWAMRAGLMSRFIGILGAVLGGLLVIGFLLPIGSNQIIQVFWLGAIGFILLGRWPGGRGPAWDSGEAEPWPSAYERRAAMQGEALADRSEAGEPEAEPEPEPGAEHPVSNKRRRKRRR